MSNDEKLDLILEKIQIMGSEMQSMDSRIQGLESKIQSMDSRIQGLDSKIQDMDSRIQGLDSKIQSMDSRIQGLDSKIQGLDSKIQSMDSKIQDMDSEMQDIQTKVTRIGLKVEEEISRNIQLLAENHSNFTDKLNEAIKVSDKSLIWEVQLSGFRMRLDKLENEFSEWKSKTI